MNLERRFSYSTKELRTIDRYLPDNDFVNRKYDYHKETELKSLVFILSTPRSGSTFLCDILHQNDICLPHEYFQPSQYLPYLAQRWGCISHGKLDWKCYVNQLLKHRVAENGCLGINLHGSHIAAYEIAEKYFPDVQKHYVHLTRRDKVSQAVSYEIASQTSCWSSSFTSAAPSKYSYDGILDRLHRIDKQNLLISAYLRTRGKYSEIVYEDLISAGTTVLREFPFIDSDIDLVGTANLRKQGGNLNSQWRERFLSEFQERTLTEYANQSMPKDRFIFGGLFSRIFNKRP